MENIDFQTTQIIVVNYMNSTIKIHHRNRISFGVTLQHNKKHKYTKYLKVRQIYCVNCIQTFLLKIDLIKG